MPRIPHLRLILEAEPNSGDWNMAVDEALLESAISADVATLRWYQWSEPTISLGYFQKFSEVNDDPVLSHLPVVRRLTGGGAILHDDELTHSISIPASQSLFQQPQDLYDIVHLGVVSGLRHLGFPVTLRGRTVKRPDEPLLCFQRQDAHDVTLHGQKVLGSAQRRRRGAIMEHGSLIRRASSLAKHIPGLTDLCDTSLPADLAEKLAVYVANSIAESWSVESLTASEIEMAERFCEDSVKNVHLR